MKFLIDTNVLSELRRRRPDRNVMRWFNEAPDSELFISVLTVGELRAGAERMRLRDQSQGEGLSTWLDRVLRSYESRILIVDHDVAQVWGRLNANGPVPLVDSYIAATALVHDMVVVTRNVEDFEGTGVRLLNPSDSP